jgi:hypothetical protein
MTDLTKKKDQFGDVVVSGEQMVSAADYSISIYHQMQVI